MLRSARSGILGSQTVSSVSGLVCTHGARLSNKTISPSGVFFSGPAVGVEQP